MSTCFLCELDLSKFDAVHAFAHGFVMSAIYGPTAIETLCDGLCTEHDSVVFSAITAAEVVTEFAMSNVSDDEEALS